MLEVSLSPLDLPWVIYAVGEEEGALDRAMAIAPVAASGRQVIILTNSLNAPLVRSQISRDPGLAAQVSIQFVPGIGSESAEADAILHLGQLCSIAPFVLIVDALPEGFYQELADVLPALTNIPKILILRDLLPQSAIACDLENLIENHYDLTIAPGPYEVSDAIEKSLLGSGSPVKTLPWLSQSLFAPEARSTARMALGLDAADSDRKVILVISSEHPGEHSMYSYLCATLVQQCPQVTVRCVSRLLPENCPIEIWHKNGAVTDCLPAADLVIGGGNYTTVYGCQSLAIPLVAFPWTRQDDSQRQRLDRAAAEQPSPIKIVTDAETALSSVFEFLNEFLHQAIAPNVSLPSLSPPAISGLPSAAKQTCELIESAVIHKWHQAAQTAMEKNVSQLRGQLKELQSYSRQELW